MSHHYNSFSPSHPNEKLKVQTPVTKTISITSGKGGVGKSSVVINLAAELFKQGKRVLILDGDFGMSNIDVMVGLRTPYTLYDVIKGEKRISDIIIEVLPGVHLIPGGSGIYEMQNLTTLQKYLVMEEVSSLSGQYDVFLLDTAPGISDNVLYLNAAADEVMVILTSDPASLTDAYALIKVLNQKYKTQKVSILCNMVKDEVEAKKRFKRLDDVCSQFLYISLNYRGFIPTDLNLRKSTRSQQLVVEAFPRSPSSFAFRHLSKKISGYNNLREIKGGMQFFWEQLVGAVA